MPNRITKFFFRIVIIETKECSVKVYFDLNHDKVKNNRNGVSFGGIKPVKSEDGFKTYEFSYPFDEDHQNYSWKFML